MPPRRKPKKLSSLRSTRSEPQFKRLIKRFDHRPVIITEGDSWFDHPLRRDTIDCIQNMGRFNILRLESFGDEVTKIMSGKQKKTLRNILVWHPVELILFSGGGNDIVGKGLLNLLKDRNTVSSWKEVIHKTNFNQKMRNIKKAYKDLIEIRNDKRPDCTIMAHGYDYPIPSDVGAQLVGIKIAGPWMKPYMEKRNITLVGEQKKIAKWLIQQLNEMLVDFERKTNNFIYVKTPGTLAINEWGDEIHPTNPGYKKIANKFKPKLKKLFPNTSIK